MALFQLILRRLFAQRLLALAMVVATAFGVGVLVAGPIYADASARATLAATIADAPVTATGLRLSVTSGVQFDFPAADEAVRSGLAGLPVDATVAERRTQGLSAAVIRGERTGTLGRAFSITLLARDGALGHLRVDGRIPRSDDEVAMSSGDAFFLGLATGEKLVLGTGGRTTTVRLTATYAVPNLEDPAWWADRSVFAADEDPPGGTFFPLIGTQDAFDRLVEQLRLSSGQSYVWDTTFDLSGLDAGGMRRVAAGVGQAADAIRGNAAFKYPPPLAATGLPQVVERATARAGDARAPILLVAFQVGAVVLVVLGGVATLSLSRQSFELAVLKSRGFSARQLLLAQGVQAVLTSAAALPLGLLLGVPIALLARAAHGPFLSDAAFPIHLGASAVGLGLVGAGVAALLLVLLSIPAVLQGILEERRKASRESTPLLARFPIELLAAPLGIAAFSEAKRRGIGTGGGSLDPFVLLAPTLLLVALSFFALRLLRWGLHRTDRAAGRLRRVSLYLVSRRLSRSPAGSLATALLLLLATGLLVLSSSYRATVLAGHADVAHQEIGADWAVRTGATDQPLAAIRNLPAGTTSIFRGTLDRVDHPTLPGATLLGIDPATYRDGAWWRADYATRSLKDLLEGLRVPAAGTALPAGTRTLEIPFRSLSDLSTLTLTMTLEAADGTLSTMDLGPVADGAAVYRAEANRATRVLSLTLVRSADQYPPTDVVVEAGPIRAIGDGTTRSISLDGWRPLTPGTGGTVSPVAGGAVRATLVPSFDLTTAGLLPPVPPLPILVRTGYAAPGDAFDAVACDQRIGLRVAGTLKQFPSLGVDEPFIVTSGPAFLERMASVPRPCASVNEVWAMGAHDPAGDAKAAGFPIGETRRALDVEATLGQDPQTLALGMQFAATIGGVALVVVGVAAGLYFLQRRRLFEFASLRAMGTSSRQIVTAMALEQGILVAFALGAALALGWWLLRLTIESVAPGIRGSFPSTLLRLDRVALGGFIAVVALTVTGGVALAARALIRTPVTAVLRGEAE